MAASERPTVRTSENGFIIIHDPYAQKGVAETRPQSAEDKTFTSHGHTLGHQKDIIVDTGKVKQAITSLETLIAAVDAHSGEAASSSPRGGSAETEIDYVKLANDAVAVLMETFSTLTLAVDKRLLEAARLLSSKTGVKAKATVQKDIDALEARKSTTAALQLQLIGNIEHWQVKFEALQQKLSEYQSKKHQVPNERAQELYVAELTAAKLRIKLAYEDVLTFLKQENQRQALENLIKGLRNFSKKRSECNKDYSRAIRLSTVMLGAGRVTDDEAKLDARFRGRAYVKVATVAESSSTSSQADVLHVAYSARAKRTTPLSERKNNICFVMAHCLFGNALSCPTTSGRELPLIDHSLVTHLDQEVMIEVCHDSKFSPYEKAMFAQFEQQLKLAKSLKGSSDFKLVYHLPTIGYELSGLLLHLNGKFPSGGTISCFRQYIEAVEQRSKAHRRVVESLCDVHDIDKANVVIASPFDNLYDADGVRDIYDFAGRHTGLKGSSTEIEVVDDILSRLIANNVNPVHKRAWAKVMPANIGVARRQLENMSAEKIQACSDAKLQNLAAIKSMEDLIHFANAMMFAIAKETYSNDGALDVVAMHSFDESPIFEGYNRSLSGQYGDVEALHVLPEVICQNGQGDRLFHISSKTADELREEITTAIVERYHPSAYLQAVFKKDSVDAVPERLKAPAPVADTLFTQRRPLSPQGQGAADLLAALDEGGRQPPRKQPFVPADKRPASAPPPLSMMFRDPAALVDDHPAYVPGAGRSELRALPSVPYRPAAVAAGHPG